MELHTERLLLRPVQETDAEDIFEYSRNPAVGPRAGWRPHENIEETRGIMPAVFLNQEAVWGIVLPETGKLIGTIGLVGDARRQGVPGVRMLGYAIGEPYWGVGFTTEAVKAVVKYGLQRMHMELISAYCYTDNVASRRVLEKSGFVCEGMLRRAEMLYNGDVLDVYCFCLERRRNLE